MSKTLGKDFSLEEIQAIIKTCSAEGVTSLTIGNLALTLRPPEPKTPEVATPTPEQLAAAKAYENEVFLENEKRVRLQELSELRLSDPEAYEDLVNRGELEHVGEDSEVSDRNA